jgi:hypothetical protein
MQEGPASSSTHEPKGRGIGSERIPVFVKRVRSLMHLSTPMNRYPTARGACTAAISHSSESSAESPAQLHVRLAPQHAGYGRAVELC